MCLLTDTPDCIRFSTQQEGSFFNTETRCHHLQFKTSQWLPTTFGPKPILHGQAHRTSTCSSPAALSIASLALPSPHTPWHGPACSSCTETHSVLSWSFFCPLFPVWPPPLFRLHLDFLLLWDPCWLLSLRQPSVSLSHSRLFHSLHNSDHHPIKFFFMCMCVLPSPTGFWAQSSIVCSPLCLREQWLAPVGHKGWVEGLSSGSSSVQPPGWEGYRLVAGCPPAWHAWRF